MQGINTPVFKFVSNAQKLQKKSLNFFHCVQPVYIISRIFGLLPFSIQYNPNGCVKAAKVTVFDGFWFIGSIGLNLFFGYRVASDIPDMPKEESSILFIGFRTVFVICFILTALSTVLDMMNRNRIVKIVKDLTEFDNSVSKIETFTFALIEYVLRYLNCY